MATDPKTPQARPSVFKAPGVGFGDMIGPAYNRTPTLQPNIHFVPEAPTNRQKGDLGWTQTPGYESCPFPVRGNTPFGKLK